MYNLTLSDGGEPIWYWSPITDGNETGAGWIVALMAMAFVLVATALRVSLKRWILKADDAIIGVAVVCMTLGDCCSLD